MTSVDSNLQLAKKWQKNQTKVHRTEWNRGGEQMWYPFFLAMWGGGINWLVLIRWNHTTGTCGWCWRKYVDSKIWGRRKALFFFVSSTKILPQCLKVPEIKIAGSWGNHGDDVPTSLPFPYIVPSSSDDPGTLAVYQSFIHVSNIDDHVLQLLDLLVFFFLLLTFSSIYSAISTTGVSQMRMKKLY